MKFGRIMIIDDDVEFLRELKDYLSSAGREVVALTSGTNAERRALSERPDVILVELSAGPGGGVKIAERLKNTAGVSRIPVVYLTGYYSVLSENPDVKICLKRHFNPGRILKELESFF